MNVISYGEDKPVSPNNNRAGRAENRRVVVKVLS
jgi:peptidoglycan-associated lipoprotein